MASQNTTLFAAQITPSTSGFTDALDAGARTVTIADSYLTTSAVADTGEVLRLCKLPKGAKVVSAELLVPASIGTSSAKLGYGTIASDGTVTVVDDDRWGSAVNLSTVGRKQFLITAADADYETTTEVAVVLTPVTTAFADAKTFTFIITYTTR